MRERGEWNEEATRANEIACNKAQQLPNYDGK